MNYTLAVFQSRYATLNFANILRENNIPAAVVNTPREAGATCGISVKFLSDYLSKVQILLSRYSNKNFAGFYTYIKRNGRMIIVKI